MLLYIYTTALQNLSTQIAFITTHFEFMRDQLRKLDRMIKEHPNNTPLIGIIQKISNLLSTTDDPITTLASHNKVI